MTGRREDEVKCTVGNPAAPDAFSGGGAGGRRSVGGRISVGNFKASKRRREGSFKALLKAASSNRVSEVGAKLNSAWFLIAPACDFLTDAISAN